MILESNASSGTVIRLVCCSCSAAEALTVLLTRLWGEVTVNRITSLLVREILHGLERRSSYKRKTAKVLLLLTFKLKMSHLIRIMTIIKQIFNPPKKIDSCHKVLYLWSENCWQNWQVQKAQVRRWTGAGAEPLRTARGPPDLHWTGRALQRPSWSLVSDSDVSINSREKKHSSSPSDRPKNSCNKIKRFHWREWRQLETTVCFVLPAAVQTDCGWQDFLKEEMRISWHTWAVEGNTGSCSIWLQMWSSCANTETSHLECWEGAAPHAFADWAGNWLMSTLWCH